MNKSQLGWWFETGRFQDCETQEEEVNPGRYGEGLAKWIAQELEQRGWEVSDVFPEDLGWTVRLTRSKCRLRLACGNEDGSKTRWGVMPEARPGFMQRLFGTLDADGIVRALDTDLGEVIRSDPGTTWLGKDQPMDAPLE